MTRQKPGMFILALVASLSVFTLTSQAQKKAAPQATASSQQVPAEYQAGIAKLRAAKGYLEKAGEQWCGHRVEAIRYIDQAFQALGVSPESTPTEMNSGKVNEPKMMNQGIMNLQAAKADFEKAGSGWGGKKVNGLNHINQALEQTQKGIACAKEHKTY